MVGLRRCAPILATGGLVVLLAVLARPAAGAAPQVAVMTGKPPSRAEFVDRLARLCDARHRAVTSLGVPFVSPRDYASQGSDLMRIERNFDSAQHALARPARHGLVDRAEAQYHRYRQRLPALVSASRQHRRRAWVLMYDAQAFLTYASNLIQAYGGRRFCDIGP